MTFHWLGKQLLLHTLRHSAFTSCIVMLLFAVYPLFTHATDGTLPEKWYEVQMVVFLNKNLPTKEHWPQNQGAAIIPENAITLKAPEQLESSAAPDFNLNNDTTTSVQTTPVQTTPTQETTAQRVSQNPLQPNLADDLMVWLPPNNSFAGVITRLEQSGHYPVLYTARWRMPLQAYHTPVTIAIQAAPDAAGLDTLTGSVTFSRKRFFYVQPDLTYARPVTFVNNSLNTTTATEAAFAQYFPMKQRQRITLNELTYIDNPVIGILVQITPYTVPTTSISTETPAKIHSGNRSTDTIPS